MKLLNTQIKTKQDIKNYIDDLALNNMLYHFEDDAKDIVNFQNMPKETLDLLDLRSNEALSIDYNYSFEYMCELLEI